MAGAEEQPVQVVGLAGFWCVSEDGANGMVGSARGIQVTLRFLAQQGMEWASCTQDGYLWAEQGFGRWYLRPLLSVEVVRGLLGKRGWSWREWPTGTPVRCGSGCCQHKGIFKLSRHKMAEVEWMEERGLRSRNQEGVIRAGKSQRGLGHQGPGRIRAWKVLSEPE